MTYMGTTINDSATIVLPAGAELEGIQGLAVGISDGAVALPTAGANAIGVALFSNEEKVKAGEDVQIQIRGIGKMIASGAIAIGDEVATDAAGKAAKATSGQFIIGTALTAATAAGSVIDVQISKSGYKA